MPTSDVDFEILFLGGGFRTTTFLASAPWLLKRRIGIVEKRTRVGGGDFHGYAIQSTSIGSRFFKDIDLKADFAPLLSDDLVGKVANAKGPIDLRQLASALDRVGAVLTGALPAEAVMTGCAGREIVVCGGAPRVTLDTGQELTSRHLVIATGRHELLHPALEMWRDKTILSGHLLNPAEEARTLDTLDMHPTKPIVVAGSSHSAMSALRVLLALRARAPQKFGKREILVLQRSKARLFYSSREEARIYQDLNREVPVTDAAVCSASGNVFRDTGLRHESKAIFLRASQGQISQVSMMPISLLQDQRDLYDRAALIVQALGYVGRTPKIMHSSGRMVRAPDTPFRLAADRQGRVLIDGSHRNDITALRLDPTPPEYQDNAQYGQELYRDLSTRLSEHLKILRPTRWPS
ncbi:hypothetical protein [Rathayibacter tritici]|nr:hypothetical protein [Rathayibacter tritici]